MTTDWLNNRLWLNLYGISTVFSIKICLVYNASFSLHQDQKGLPEELFAVKMYALTTDLPKKVHRTKSKVQANRPGVIKWELPFLTYIETDCIPFDSSFWSWVLVICHFSLSNCTPKFFARTSSYSATNSVSWYSWWGAYCFCCVNVRY